MIDFNDPAAVCRSLDYFLTYLGAMAPLVGLSIFAWRIAR
jgi:hypothetical protein